MYSTYYLTQIHFLHYLILFAFKEANFACISKSFQWTSVLYT